MGLGEEEIYRALEDAKRHAAIAEHILTLTYPLVQDNKLLISSLENTFLSFANALTALLTHEKSEKRISDFEDTFDAKISLYQEHCIARYQNKGLGKDHAIVMQEMKNIIMQHKKSALEFARKDAYVFCSDSCETETITVEKLAIYLKKAKLFIDTVHFVLKKNE